MKNRKLSILIVLVVFVWGTIGFKIYDNMSEDPTRSIILPAKFVMDTVYQERYGLSLSYNDPFLKSKKEVPKKQVRTVPKSVITAPVVASEVIVNWDHIQYFGSINNSSRKIVTANVKFGTMDHLMKVGEDIDGFLLLEIHRDSVKFSFGRVSKYIKRVKR